ncbi:MAG TPA: cell wall-binding repeat-containing protein, partial [Solirubrobacterales bacterium]|nr:cell wall-binding repeat-containing protein [Solirubrobacterales bacterium]
GLLGGGDDEGGEAETKVVTVAVETDDADEAPVGPLGFPLVATRNTTRVGGPDPADDAAAVALATHPPSPRAEPVEAAVLVEDTEPYAGIAAAVLAGPPLRAPLLVGSADGVPASTADALAKLNPRGGGGPDDAAVYRVGDVAAPPGYQSEQVGEGSPAAIAAAVDKLRGALIGAEPQHILVASSEEAAYAMPAAAWAARSGDPVLFSGRTDVPEPTLEALRRHRGAPVYVLGPQSVISDEAVRRLERISPGVQRVGAEGPVANAIEFARFSDETFGWNITLPGHGMVVASAERPLDAAAAASLSASGKWGPLLLVDSASTLPPELRSFLLDIKPGYRNDPTAAVYNHLWLLGDSSAIGGRVQAEIDELAELAEVGPGAGGPVGPQTGGALGLAPRQDSEPEPDDQGGSGDKKGSP